MHRTYCLVHSLIHSNCSMNICLVNAHKSLKALLHKNNPESHLPQKTLNRRIDGPIAQAHLKVFQRHESTLKKLVRFPHSPICMPLKSSHLGGTKCSGSRTPGVWEEISNSLINNFSPRIFFITSSGLKMISRRNLEPSGLALGSWTPLGMVIKC